MTAALYFITRSKISADTNQTVTTSYAALTNYSAKLPSSMWKCKTFELKMTYAATATGPSGDVLNALVRTYKDQLFNDFKKLNPNMTFYETEDALLADLAKSNAGDKTATARINAGVLKTAIKPKCDTERDYGFTINAPTTVYGSTTTTNTTSDQSLTKKINFKVTSTDKTAAKPISDVTVTSTIVGIETGQQTPVTCTTASDGACQLAISPNSASQSSDPSTVSFSLVARQTNGTSKIIQKSWTDLKDGDTISFAFDAVTSQEDQLSNSNGTISATVVNKNKQPVYAAGIKIYTDAQKTTELGSCSTGTKNTCEATLANKPTADKVYVVASKNGQTDSQYLAYTAGSTMSITLTLQLSDTDAGSTTEASVQSQEDLVAPVGNTNMPSGTSSLVITATRPSRAGGYKSEEKVAVGTVKLTIDGYASESTFASTKTSFIRNLFTAYAASLEDTLSSSPQSNADASAGQVVGSGGASSANPSSDADAQSGSAATSSGLSRTTATATAKPTTASSTTNGSTTTTRVNEDSANQAISSQKLRKFSIATVTIPDNGINSKITINNLPAGIYKIDANKSGFDAIDKVVITLADASNQEVEVPMRATSNSEPPAINANKIIYTKENGLYWAGDYQYSPKYPYYGWQKVGQYNTTPPAGYNQNGVPVLANGSGTVYDWMKTCQSIGASFGAGVDAKYLAYGSAAAGIINFLNGNQTLDSFTKTTLLPGATAYLFGKAFENSGGSFNISTINAKCYALQATGSTPWITANGLQSTANVALSTILGTLGAFK